MNITIYSKVKAPAGSDITDGSMANVNGKIPSVSKYRQIMPSNNVWDI